MSDSAEVKADELGERIRAVIDEAESSLESADNLDSAALEDVAARAATLVSEVGPAQLAEAIGDADGESSSITEAMARSDRETVVALRKLLALSALHDDNDSEAFERFRSLADAEVADSSADGIDGAERLREELTDSIDEFREGIAKARESLESDEAESDDAAGSGADPSPPGDGTMLSTVPTADRVDMRGLRRFSTVRKRR